MLTSLSVFFGRLRNYFSDRDLILVDRRVLWLLVACALAFVFLVGFKFHGSSAPMWNQVFGTNPREGLILGLPKIIRSDEWYATMPMVLAQANRDYAFKNSATSAGASALLLNVPVAHPTTWARPHFWGYFLLGPERGFAWYWWSKVFGVFLGSFFALMLLSRNRFWLALFGASWLLASTFMQWWFSTTMPEMLAAGFGLFVALAYMALAKRRWLVIAAGLLAIAAAISFALTVYPPHQIPIAYLILAICVGFAVDRVRLGNLKLFFPWRIAAVLLAVGATTFLLYLFWQDARETIAVVSNTVYPGQRRIGGGGVTLPLLLVGAYSVFLSEQHFPAAWAWANVVELSGFLLLWPAAAIGLIRSWIAKVRPYATEIALLAFCIVFTVWMVLGFPGWLERITLLDRATNLRAMAALGPASIFLCVSFLAAQNKKGAARQVGRLAAIAMMLSVFLLSWLVGLDLAATTQGFFGARVVLLVSVLLAALTYLLLRRRRVIFALAILVFIVPASVQINPLSQGLTPLTNKKLYVATREIVRQDPDARWVIFDNDTVANFSKAAGAYVINGVQFAPDRAVMELLDPTRKYEDVWNRYARINFIPDTNNEAIFTLTGDASYNVTISPCASVLGDIGVRYFGFVGQLPKHIECLKEVTVAPVNDLRIFKRR